MDRLGDRETAQECWEDGLRADRNHAEMIRELARLYLSMGQFSGYQTRQSPGHAAGLGSPEQPSPRPDPARAWRSSRGRQLLATSVDLDAAAIGRCEPSEPIQQTAGQGFAANRATHEAISQLQKVLTVGPDAEASWLLSRSYLQEGDVGLASTALGQSGSYRDEHPLISEPAVYVGSARCTSMPRLHLPIRTDQSARSDIPARHRVEGSDSSRSSDRRPGAGTSEPHDQSIRRCYSF